MIDVCISYQPRGISSPFTRYVIYDYEAKSGTYISAFCRYEKYFLKNKNHAINRFFSCGDFFFVLIDGNVCNDVFEKINILFRIKVHGSCCCSCCWINSKRI